MQRQEEHPQGMQRILPVLIAANQQAAPFHGAFFVSIFDLAPVFQLSKDLFASMPLALISCLSRLPHWPFL